jgi:CRP/FNR family cyclic AMP-dependent transcriptional regulator
MSEQVDVFGATYEKDEVIFWEGDSGDKMYLIQSGAVEITKNLGGEETVLAVLGPGEFFG